MSGSNPSGYATKPNPEVISRLEGVLTSPLTQASLGLLATGPGENPYAGLLDGIQRGQNARFQNAQLRALQEGAERRQMYQKLLRDRLAAIYGTLGVEAPSIISGASQGTNPTAPHTATPIPGATPGINPAAPAVTPTATDSLTQAAQAMMMYGTPAQQLAAYNAMTSQERFRQQADREDARFQQTREDRQQQLAASKIGQYNPRDYTSESFAEFVRNRDPSALERYERIRVVDIGGVPVAVDTTTGQEIGPVGGGRDAVLQNVYDIKQAGSTGAAQGTATASAQETLAGMTSTEAQLQQVLSDPNFSQSVGPIDAITGRIGEAFGTEQGVLGGQADRLANQLVVEAVSNWKGAISEREMDFFLKSVPGRGSSAETWAHWFYKEYLPRKERVARIARGDAFSRPQSRGASSAAPSGTLPGGIKWRLEE